MVPEEKIKPNTDAIRRDLEFMTARWSELSEPAVFEVRAFKEGSQPQTAKFAADWIDEAVDWIANMNNLAFNIYAVRNPIRHSVNGSARDSDIICSFFLWADCDDPASAGNVKRFDGPKYTAAVTTGRTPETRVHVYWSLQDPVYDLDEWRAMQVRVAGHFNSDRSVINPSRIMRVGGTVTYPAKKKRERGYVSELTTFRSDYEDPREPVTLDQMGRVFKAAAPAERHTEATGGFEIDTGPQTLDREQTRIQALSGKDWHDAVIRLVGSYVSRGLEDHEIHQLTDPLTLAGYTVEETRAEVQTAINGARSKGWTPETPRETIAQEITPEDAEKIEPFPFRPWVRKALENIPYPEFIYSDFYARGYTSVTLAAPKVGKSMLGLAEAIDMATGRGFLSGIKRDPIKVVYFNAEDDEHVIDARISALLTHYGIDQDEIVGQLFPTSGVELDNFYLSSGQEGVINEPLFVAIEKFIAQQGADALIFDPLQDLTRSPETNEVFRLLGQRLRRMSSTCGVALGLVHHTRKVAPGVTPTIDDMRGGSALRGTARFNRILVSMTEDEAVKARVENHRHYFRIGDMESNLAPPSADVNRWYEKVSVLAPNGQHIGAVEPWKWPDEFEGVSVEMARRVQVAVMQADPRPRKDIQARDWVGNIIGNILGVDVADKGQRARVNAIVKKWIENDVLAVERVFDPAKGTERPVVVAGRNNLADGEQ